MTQYANPTPLSSLTNTMVQAAEASIMEERMNAILQADVSDPIISLAFAGAGDGYTFICSVEQSDESGGGVLLDEDNVIGCYMGSTAPELQVAKTAMIARLNALPPPEEGQHLDILDELFAGAAKGTVFMGMVVCVWAGGG